VNSTNPSSRNIKPPLVAHVVQRLAVGGLENGLINLINHMPADRYRHAIICLARSTAYSKRIRRDGVPVFELHQRKGWDFDVHRRFFKLMREVRPAIVHTRNLPALEFQIIAALAGVRARVHGEHGRDMYDLDGANIKYKLLRKAMRPFISQYTAVSMDLARWLVDTIGVRPGRVSQIYNGVDIVKFNPRGSDSVGIYPEGFVASDSFVVGTVGRLEPVKDQLTLVQAFLHVVQDNRDARERMRLVIIGDGSLRQPAKELLRNANLDGIAWLPGERTDVPDLMRAMDLFVLPSLREGISNTILEAMATGLPVAATSVGGNPELVTAGETGDLVPHSNPPAMAQAIANYFSRPEKAREHGRNARRKAEREFSMEAMVNGYLRTYDNVLQQRQAVVLPEPSSTSS
jgi:sugar transferase (PEP-CTERM/EpsH1 system associated)